MEHLRSVELLIIPLVFITGNLLIYFIHRFLLHKRVPFFEYGHKMHTLMHHQFFTDQLYGYDYKLAVDVVLFPLWFIFFITLILAPSLGFLASIFFSNDIAWLTIFMTNTVFISYEIVHFCSHLEKDYWIHKFSLFRLKLVAFIDNSEMNKWI